MFNEPTEREVNLMPLVVHGADEALQREQLRSAGFGTCGQITVCISGEGSFIDSNSREYKIGKGDVFFVAPETAHRYTPTKEPWIVKYIVFSGCELESVFESLGLPRSGAVCGRADFCGKSAALVDRIFTSYNSGRKSRHITASAYLYKLLALISEHTNPHRADRHEQLVQRLAPAVEYINGHFADKALSSELIAEGSGISHPHLCRLFKNAYNMSPHEYIVGTRIDYAKYLLTNEKDLTVQTISDRCGFSSAGYFTKVFKSKTGITPIEFRVQNTYSF